mgnify:CR=1 FL=1
MSSNDDTRDRFASLIRRSGGNVHSDDQNRIPRRDSGPNGNIFLDSVVVRHHLRQPSHLPSGKREFVGYVYRVVTNKTRSQDDFTPGVANVDKGRERDPFNAGTKIPNWHITVFIPEIHGDYLGYNIPKTLGKLSDAALLICVPENEEVAKTQGVPAIGDEVVIYYDPAEEMGAYRRKKSSGIDLRPALDPLKNNARNLSTTNMRNSQFISSIVAGEYYTPPESDDDTLVGDTKFNKKQPAAWLKSCAERNNWGMFLVDTQLSPEQKSTIVQGGETKIKQFYEPRIFTNTKAKEAQASAENKLFGVVLSDGAQNLNLMWNEFEKRGSSTHYGIDHNGRVHEFIDPTNVAYHSAARSCPGNNVMSIGISMCQFGFKYEHAFNGNSIKNKLKSTFMNLLKGKNLFVGNPDYVGLPHNVLAQLSTTNSGMPNDTYLLASKAAMESSWKLTSCLSEKYNFPLDSPAIVKYMRTNFKPNQFSDPARTPYVYNFGDLTTIIKNNAVCGYDGLITYPGVRARPWITAGRTSGGSATEYYMFCRMLNLTPDEAYYATLGSLTLPGTTKNSKINASAFLDLGAYIGKYGNIFVNNSFVPNPIDGKQMLTTAGKKIFNVADAFRKQLIIDNTHTANESAPGAPPINFGAIAGYQVQDAWSGFLWEKENYLGAEPTLEHCLYIMESARKKVFAEYQYLNNSIPDSKYSEFSTQLGQWLTRTAVNMVHVSAVAIKPPPLTPLTSICAKNPEFEAKFLEKYKISFKGILNL